MAMSGTLKKMKFMQKVKQKEEKPTKEEELVIPESNFAPAAVKKCVVIMEGDPHPGEIRGRMSFRRFNPAIDQLNDGVSNSNQPEESATSSGKHDETMSDRNDSANDDILETYKQKTSSIYRDLKRKLEEVLSETEHSNESPQNYTSQKESFKHHQPKKEKLDWNVLRPRKSQGKNKK